MAQTTSGNMEFNVVATKTSRQHKSTINMRESVLSSKEIQRQKNHDKLKLQTDLSYTNLRKSRKNADHVLSQPKCLGKPQKKEIRDDELVKHMSNLPGYLQRVDKGENLQEKVLNVGVLEWGRLEKWKHNQRSLPTRRIKGASSYSSYSPQKMTSRPPNFSIAGQSGQSQEVGSVRSTTISSLNGSRSEVAKQSIQKLTCYQHPETTSKSLLDGSRRACKSSGRTIENKMPVKITKKDLAGKDISERRYFLSSTRNDKHSLHQENGYSTSNAVARIHVKDLQADIKDERLKEEIPSELGAKLRSNPVIKDNTEKSNIDLCHQHCTIKNKNIMLLLPRKFPKSSFSEACQLSDPRTSCDEKHVDGNWCKQSHSFSSVEVCSSELGSKILHSYPLPLRVETNSEPGKIPQRILSDQPMKFPCDASQFPPSSSKMPSKLNEGKYSKINEVNIKTIEPRSVEHMKLLDEQTADRETTEGGNSSPKQRFSFSRMSRSFSLKEGSRVPEFSSTYVSVKSGPVRCKDSAWSDNSSIEKASNVHKRARSSPLRRLLDPLLKSKTENSPHSSDAAQTMAKNLNLSSLRSIKTNGSFQNVKHGTSRLQALLQLTVKNDIPMFKFVVDNNSILVATVKNFNASKKFVCQNFTFYSVQENKKKVGGWISQGNKGKHCGYIYNVVGQMKTSVSFTEQHSNNKCVIKDSVLYGIEANHGNDESFASTQYKELAAVIVKIPVENLSHGEKPSNTDKDLKQGKGFTEMFPDGSCSSSTIIILPGGVHGFPDKGVPSSLIERWNSGGSCDCGGWDVGCKLLILSNGMQYFTTPETSKSCLIPDHLQLFIQEGAQQDMPVFSLMSLKNGIYSIEFSASMSFLQAFFICVAVTNCESLCDLSKMSNISEVQVLQDPTSNGNNAPKTSTIFHGEFPSKYVPIPPNSPVGRV